MLASFLAVIYGKKMVLVRLSRDLPSSREGCNFFLERREKEKEFRKIRRILK